MFSDHFKRTLKLIGIGVALLLGGFIWLKSTIHDIVAPPQIVLPPNDIEQIKVDPSTHQLIITTSKGSQTVTLPDRTSTIDVLKNGTVKVTSPQFGVEHHMFVGLTMADHARIGAGLDALYWKRLDLGLGVADQVGSYTPIVFAKVTYNIKGNMQVGLIYGSNQYIGGIASVRIF